MKILHNAEYALSILNVVDYHSEKLVLKLFELFSGHFQAIKSQTCPKLHYVDFCIFLWPPLVNCAPSGIVLKDPFFPLTQDLMKKLALTFN